MRFRPPTSLRSRLVITAVGLVALVSLLVSAATTVGMRTVLMERLDQDVQSFAPGPSRAGPGNRPGLVVAYDEAGSVLQATYSSPRGEQLPVELDEAQTAAATQLPTDGEVHSIDVPELGRFRAKADNGLAIVGGLRSQITIVNGLSTHEVDETVSTLLGWELLLSLLGVLLALAASLVLVRRQLRPLQAVAETARTVSQMRLDTGEASIDTRVPDELTDAQTEAGQVGAALNTLLDHVEEALSARHRSEQQVRQFVADASHELRTPLATIAGYAELSRRRLTGSGPEDAEALLAALGKVETESGRMSTLVEDLLVLARLDAGRPLAQDEVDLTRLLLEAVADARVLAPGHHWRLDLSDEPVTLTGDAARLHQLVSNLLANARTHTPPGTTVTVSVRPGRITVSDDGPGLSPDLVDRAFERFARGDSSRTRASGGTGLGLSLVAAIAQAHGGRASVRSRPGETTFEVSLPAAPS